MGYAWPVVKRSKRQSVYIVRRSRTVERGKFIQPTNVCVCAGQARNSGERKWAAEALEEAWQPLRKTWQPTSETT